MKNSGDNPPNFFLLFLRRSNCGRSISKKTVIQKRYGNCTVNASLLRIPIFGPILKIKEEW